MIPDLIYDVGMYDGEDTAYYLSKGFRVVAIEANPDLVKRARTKFAAAIAEQRLTILNVAVTPTAGPLDFWINDEVVEFSSYDQEVGCRNGMPCHCITVQGVPFQDILRQHGVPFYLKIDIEAADIYCLCDLERSYRPQYISVEATRLDLLWILHSLGYNAFKCVDQTRHSSRAGSFNNEHFVGRLQGLLRWYALRARNLTDKLFPSAHQRAFPPGTSGPFGEDTPGEWQSLERVAYNWLHFHLGHRRRGTLNMRGWYDFHATTQGSIHKASGNTAGGKSNG